MSLRLLGGCALAALLLARPSAAQVYSIPTPYPQISASGYDWYEQRQPILFAGDLYYPAGPQVHFNGDIMIPTGTFDGVPLYADASVEAYSEILVPVGGGLVQPYERRRTGPIAGTTGSHAPSFPVDVVPGESPAPESQMFTGNPPRSNYPMQWQRAPEEGEYGGPPSRGDEEARLKLLQQPGRIETIRPPEDNRGIWIRYEGARWNAAGNAVPFDAARFSRVGEYYGFPVYAARDSEDVFIPAWPGMLADYRKDAGK